jgi:hypothetical protein
MIYRYQKETLCEETTCEETTCEAVITEDTADIATNGARSDEASGPDGECDEEISDLSSCGPLRREDRGTVTSSWGDSRS